MAMEQNPLSKLSDEWLQDLAAVAMSGAGEGVCISEDFAKAIANEAQGRDLDLPTAYSSKEYTSEEWLKMFKEWFL
jgi:hypothetical protein